MTRKSRQCGSSSGILLLIAVPLIAFAIFGARNFASSAAIDQQAAFQSPTVDPAAVDPAESENDTPSQKKNDSKLDESKPDGSKSDGNGKGETPKPVEKKPLPPGWIAFGDVRLDPKEKRIEVDGVFNLRRGLLEFLACAPGIKSHETLVTLDIDPRNLNLALLTLGLAPKARPKHDTDTRQIEGDRVVIFLRWQQKDADGKLQTIERRAEECIVNYLAEEVMDPSGFVFTGSTFIPSDPRDFRPPGSPPPPGAEPGSNPPSRGARPGGRLPGEGDPKGSDGAVDSAADRAGDPKKKSEMIYAPLVIGQFIALVHRPFAILDNPLQLPYPDPEFGAYGEMLPPFDPDDPTPVTLILRRPKPGEIDPNLKRMSFKPLPPIKEGDDAEEKDADGDDPVKDEPKKGDGDGQ